MPEYLPVALDSAEADAIINLLIPLVFRSLGHEQILISARLQKVAQDVLRNLKRADLLVALCSFVCANKKICSYQRSQCKESKSVISATGIR